MKRIKNLIKNSAFNSILFILIFLFGIEICFRLIEGIGLSPISLLRIFLEDLILANILGLITSYFKKKITYIINTIIIFAASFYSYLQLGFNSYIGVYMSFNTTSQLGAVKDYINDFIKAIKPNYYLVFIPFIISLILLIIFLTKKNKEKEKFIKKYKFTNAIKVCESLIIIIISVLVFNNFLDEKYMEDEYQVINNKELFLNASNPTLFVKNFGVVPFCLLDYRTKVVASENVSLSYLSYGNSDDINREFDDSKWEELIESENNKTFNELNNFFIHNAITDENEYTGIFKDKNLIIIMMESVNDIIYNKKLFPNFYRLASEGMYFTNNYSPRNSCATGNNEFSAMTGLYSIYNTCTANVYKENKYFNSIFNLFNNDGYYTSSYHNFTEGYYYRSKIHTNMGSQKYFGVDDLDIDYYDYYGGWASDEDLMYKYLEKLDESQSDKFMSYITTVSSHQPYAIESPFGDKYLNLTEDTDYSMDIRRYISKLKVLDNALGILVGGLEERDLLDDTVIVLFGDHYPYGISLEHLNEVLDRSLEDDENEKVPLVIYNPKLEGSVNETYTTFLNLTPTLANMFGLKTFDPRLYAGMDIFSSSYNNTAVFTDGSWENENAYYSASTGNLTYFTDKIYTTDEIKGINNEIYVKMSACALAIKNDYFNYLDENLNKNDDEDVLDSKERNT